MENGLKDSNLEFLLKKIRFWFWTVLILILIVFGFLIIKDAFGFKKSRNVIITVKEGEVVKNVAETLKSDGLITFPLVFRLRASAGNYVIKQGKHIIDNSMSYGEMLAKLSEMPDAGYADIVKVLIPEGYEVKDIASTLFEKGLIPDEESFIEETEKGRFDYPFIKKIKRDKNRLEGYLFPATYEIRLGESEHSIINKMLEKFNEVVVPLYENSDTKYSLDEIVTLASMIESEAANDDERPIISSVFYNRLDKNMYLGSCATVLYVTKDRKKVLSVADTKIKSLYNTYINKGLPPGPISAPGEASIKAALNPQRTPYLYFAAKSDGSGNIFSKTEAEHLKVINKVQK